MQPLLHNPSARPCRPLGGKYVCRVIAGVVSLAKKISFFFFRGRNGRKIGHAANGLRRITHNRFRKNEKPLHSLCFENEADVYRAVIVEKNPNKTKIHSTRDLMRLPFCRHGLETNLRDYLRFSIIRERVPVIFILDERLQRFCMSAVRFCAFPLRSRRPLRPTNDLSSWLQDLFAGPMLIPRGNRSNVMSLQTSRRRSKIDAVFLRLQVRSLTSSQFTKKRCHRVTTKKPARPRDIFSWQGAVKWKLCEQISERKAQDTRMNVVCGRTVDDSMLFVISKPRVIT